LDHLARHQLYDAPVRPSTDTVDSQSTLNPGGASPKKAPLSPGRQSTIKFGAEDVAHYYPSPGKTGTPIHEQRHGHSTLPSGAMTPSPVHGGPVLGPPTRSAPASQTGFGRGVQNLGGSSDPWRSLPPIAVPSKSDTMSSGYEMGDTGMDSLASLQGDGGHDVFDSPPGPSRQSGNRYPIRGEDDPVEHQRLVRTRSSDSESDPEMKAGGVRLIPTLPKIPRMGPL